MEVMLTLEQFNSLTENISTLIQLNSILIGVVIGAIAGASLLLIWFLRSA